MSANLQDSRQYTKLHSALAAGLNHELDPDTPQSPPASCSLLRRTCFPRVSRSGDPGDPGGGPSRVVAEASGASIDGGCDRTNDDNELQVRS